LSIEELHTRVSQLSQDKEYLSTLSIITNTYLPKIAETVVESNKETSNAFMNFMKAIGTKLADGAKRAVSEILAVSSTLKAKIISFGNASADLLRKLGTYVATIPSQWKQYLKQHSKVKGALRIGLAITSVAMLQLLAGGGVEAPINEYAKVLAEEGLIVVMLNG
jgi:hypothetical protein